MRERKCYHERIGLILDFCKLPRKVHEIRTHCCIRGDEAKQLLHKLIECRLLSKVVNDNVGTSFYLTTVKGIIYLKTLNKLNRMLEEKAIEPP